jgi:hypothetical protein
MCSSYFFSTSAIDGGEWSASRPIALYPQGKDPGTHCTGGWVGPRAGLDTGYGDKSSRLLRGSKLDRPVVQPVVRHYTDWVTSVHIFICAGSNSICWRICTVVRDRVPVLGDPLLSPVRESRKVGNHCTIGWMDNQFPVVRCPWWQVYFV